MDHENEKPVVKTASHDLVFVARTALNAWMDDVLASAKRHNIKAMVFAGTVQVNGQEHMTGGIASGDPMHAGYCAGYAMSEAKNYLLTEMQRMTIRGSDRSSAERTAAEALTD